MPDLERQLRQACPDWPAPSPAAEARARAALGLPGPESARSWAARALRPRNGARLLAAAALLVTAGAAVAATLIARSGSSAPVGPAASLAFGSPVTVGRPVSQIDGLPVVAVDGRGVVTVAWGRAGRIVVATRSADGAWSAPVRISDPAKRASYPAIGSDAAGDTTVVWRERTEGRRITQSFRLPSGAPAGELSDLIARKWAVVARRRSPAGTWGPPQEVSQESATVRDMESPGLAVFRDGSSLVTWDVADALWASAGTVGGAWQAPARVGFGPGEAVDPHLTSDPSGHAALVWSNRAGLGVARRYTIHVARFASSAGWGSDAGVGTPIRNPPHALAAINSSGAALVAWTDPGNFTAPGRLHAATASASGSWSEDVRVGSSGRGLNDVQALPAMTGQGDAVLVAGSRAYRLTPGGTWSALKLDRVTGRPFAAALRTDPSGTLVLVRGTITPTRSVVERLTGDPSRRQSAQVGGVSFQLALAIGADGTTALAWVGQGTSPGVVIAVAPAKGGGG